MWMQMGEGDERPPIYLKQVDRLWVWYPDAGKGDWSDDGGGQGRRGGRHRRRTRNRRSPRRWSQGGSAVDANGGGGWAICERALARQHQG